MVKKNHIYYAANKYFQIKQKFEEIQISKPRGKKIRDAVYQ